MEIKTVLFDNKQCTIVHKDSFDALDGADDNAIAKMAVDRILPYLLKEYYPNGFGYSTKTEFTCVQNQTKCIIHCNGNCVSLEPDTSGIMSEVSECNVENRDFELTITKMR